MRLTGINDSDEFQAKIPEAFITDVPESSNPETCGHALNDDDGAGLVWQGTELHHGFNP